MRARGRKERDEATSKVNKEQGLLSDFVIALLSVQIEVPRSREMGSRIVYGKELDLAIALATADLRKSMTSQ